MIKDKNKEVYTSPITEALELNFEGVLCGSKDGVFGEDPHETDASGSDWGF